MKTNRKPTVIIAHPHRSIRTRCTAATLLLVLTVLAVLIMLDETVLPLSAPLDADADTGLLEGRGLEVLLIGFGLVLTAGAGGATWWAVGRALRPIRAFLAHIDKITATDPGRRLPIPPGGDEFAELARAANLTFARLEEAVVRQQDFAATASHELRNPIAGLRAELEDAIEHPEDTDPAHSLRAALTTVDRLDAIVADLLVQARLDAGVTAPHELIDLPELLVQEAVRMNKVIDGIPVRLDTAKDVWIFGSRIQLSRALANLVGNARRHAASSVGLSLTTAGDDAVIAVTDDGPGVPPAERQRIFERFTRLEDARRLDSGGSGLGLAITRDIADRHGGSLNLEDSAVGARFVLRVPRLLVLQ
ncbi:sensor histidine kinase [Herbidospora mongoliensis]|uniref:sensor histidine kinase n=1 Tax=Herbidospora mongoliensis TaxID=688067 RepID=UPI00082ADC5F|nr:HAMP domain-containing sensor histidine kinase [Herbidospora mongoliensis]